METGELLSGLVWPLAVEFLGIDAAWWAIFVTILLFVLARFLIKKDKGGRDDKWLEVLSKALDKSVSAG